MKLPFPRLSSAIIAFICAHGVLTIGHLRADEQKPKPTSSASSPAQAAAARRQAGEQNDGSVLVTTNQMVTPLGKVQKLSGERPKDMALSPDGSMLAVLTTGKVHFFKVADGTEESSVSVRSSSLGIAWHPDGKTVFASGIGGTVSRIGKAKGGWKTASFVLVDPEKQAVKVHKPQDTSPPSDAKPETPVKPEPHVTGLAVSPDGQRLYAALSISNAVIVYDLIKGEATGIIPTGLAPYRILLSTDGKTLYTANRAGRAAQADEPAALSAGTPVRVDPETDAVLRGSVSIIDTTTFAAVEIEAGRQPSALAFSPDQKLIYLAQSDEDTIGVLDLGTRKFMPSISLLQPMDPGFGQIPTDLAVSGDGKTLFVACGGINAVAAVDLPEGKVSGYFPAGWFPIALAESKGALLVASSKGFGARASTEGKAGRAVKASLGTVQFITAEQRKAKSEHTRRVALNNGWGQEELPPRRDRAPVPVPERVGEPSVFKHVVFVIKENHTYDSDLGDISEGNGDPSLCVFGEAVTPNQRALARQWVLLDNTYTSGTNSADGHQWTVSGVANAYMEQNFAVKARSYPYNGGDPLAYSPKGFLWNAAVKAGKSVRVYGEYANKTKVVDKTGEAQKPTWKNLWDDRTAGAGRFEVTATTENAALVPHLDPAYAGFQLTVSDQARADRFLADLKAWTTSGDMPALSIMLLPCDHTSGTSPGAPTPRAMVADNDLALGRIVEGISHSPFWKETLILVIEDDSQLGLDHVDGHRTTAYCVSPYTKRGAVISEVYNHTSLLRTIGLVLGLPAMNRFDRTATPMSACFMPQRDDRPFEHLENRIPLDEMNPPLSALKGTARQHAAASLKLDWSEPDVADATTLARAVWAFEKPGRAFPWKKFHPAVDEDDDDE